MLSSTPELPSRRSAAAGPAGSEGSRERVRRRRREFAARGYAGANVDRIARAARLNKAMIYYHFKSKAALYREILRDMFGAAGARSATWPPPRSAPRTRSAPSSPRSPTEAEARPHFPPIWLREIAEGGEHVDAATLVDVARRSSRALGGIIAEGVRAAVQPTNPLLVHGGIIAPLMFFLATAPLRARIGRAVERDAASRRDMVVAHIQRLTLAQLEGRRSTGEGPGHGREGPAEAGRDEAQRPACHDKKDRKSMTLTRRVLAIGVLAGWPGRHAGAAAGAARTTGRSRHRLRRGDRGPRGAAKSADGCWSFAVAEGDRVSAGATSSRGSTRRTPSWRCGAPRPSATRPQAQLALLRAGSRPEDIRQAAAQVRVGAGGRAGRAGGARRGRRRSRALRGAARSQRRLAQAARRCGDAAGGGGGAGRGGAQDRAQARDRGARPARRPVRAPQEIDGGARACRAVDAQIATLQKSARRRDGQVARSAGIVTAKLVDAGEMVAPRTPVVVITDLDHAWANVYVDEPVVPRLKLGQAATLVTDAGQRLDGTITFISPKAEFTPRNVQTADERSKLVYRIKVTADNRDGVLKPGMPVEAELAARQ